MFVDTSRFIFVLSVTDLAEIKQALGYFQSTKLDAGHLTAESFPLPTLGPKLRLMSKRLHEGEGFLVLRGLTPWEHTKMENTFIFLGLSSYVGNKRAIQCPGGPTMTHVFDYSTEVEKQAKMNDGYLGHANRTSALPFHTDDGDVIALYCLHSAQIGGKSLLASSWAIYDRLKDTRPDVIDTLKEDWTWDSFMKDNPSFQRPLLMEHEGHLICNYRIRPFLGSPDYPRNPDLEPLSDRQRDALQVVGELAREVALSFVFKTGDVQYFNNLSILHAREAFSQAPGDDARRHLLRIVLRDDENGWNIPEPLGSALDGMYEHMPEEERFPWSPEPLPYAVAP